MENLENRVSKLERRVAVIESAVEKLDEKLDDTRKNLFGLIKDFTTIRGQITRYAKGTTVYVVGDYTIEERETDMGVVYEVVKPDGRRSPPYSNFNYAKKVLYEYIEGLRIP